MRKITKQACEAFLQAKPFQKDNTKIIISNGEITTIKMCLHNNPIAICKLYSLSETKPTGLSDLILSDCGWQTTTTKERLNGLLQTLHEKGLMKHLLYIFQKNHTWYINTSLYPIPWDEYQNVLKNMTHPIIFYLPHIIPYYYDEHGTCFVPAKNGKWSIVYINDNDYSYTIPINDTNLKAYKTPNKKDALKYAYYFGITENVKPNWKLSYLEI